MNVLNMTPEQRAEYERNSIRDMSQKSQLYTAEVKGIAKGRTEGHTEEKEEAIIRGYWLFWLMCRAVLSLWR